MERNVFSNILDTRVQYANRYVLLNSPRQSVTIELSAID